MKKQCKRALLSLASISMCLTTGIGIFAESEQFPVTYPSDEGDYTFEKISHANNPRSTADGIVDYVGNGVVSANDQGQGDRGQSYSWAAESYGDYMYVGTCYAAMGNTLTYMDTALGDSFDKEIMKATLDALFCGTFFYGQEDGEDSDGVLVKVNVKTGETKLLMADSMNGLAPLFRNAIKFRNKLYFCGSVRTNGQRGLPSIYEVDPETDEVKLVYRGIDPKDAYAAAQQKISTGIRGMAVYNDQLVISCVGLEGPYIMISSDPSNGEFTKIATKADLFNYPAYRYSDSVYGGSIWEICVFNNDLYVALCTGTPDNKPDEHTMQSFAIVKGHEENGSWTWTPVVGDLNDGAKYTFGIDPQRTRAGACNMLVYDGYLYIGEYQDIEIALEDVLFKKNVEFLAKNLEQSVNLYRMDKNEDIELVVGDATEMFPHGSLSGQHSGFGQHENTYFWQSTEYKGTAYFGMFDSSSLLEPIGQLTNGDLLKKKPEEWKEQLNYIKVLVELLLKKNSNPTPEPISLYENEVETNEEETVEEDVLTEARRIAAIRYSESSVYSNRDLDDMIALTDEQTADLEAFINEHPEDLNTVEGDTAFGLVDTMFNLTSLGYQLDETCNEQFINDYEQILDFVKKLIKYLPEDQQKKILNLVETLLQVTERDNLLAFGTILETLSTSKRGFNMYATGDGVHFTTITQNGFDDPYNHGLRVFAQTDDWMAIGTANPFYGTQLWKLQEEPTEPTDPTNPSEPVKNIFTITFNDQKGNVTTVKAEEGSEVAFPQDPACDGFRFEGWFTEAKNGTKITSLIAEKDMTVYAQWTDIKKEEVKNDKPVADTSDKTNIVIYVAGIIAALGVAGFIFKNRMHSAK